MLLSLELHNPKRGPPSGATHSLCTLSAVQAVARVMQGISGMRDLHDSYVCRCRHIGGYARWRD